MEKAFVALNKSEQAKMTEALQANAQGKAIMQSKSDTSFAGYGDLENDQVITAVRSLPCHY